jgi:hypothetical protein
LEAHIYFSKFLSTTHNPPKKSEQDFAPSQVKDVTIPVDFIDKAHEIVGSTLTAKMKCADKYTGGKFEHYRDCVLGVIAPAPVRHALSNSRRAG